MEQGDRAVSSGGDDEGVKLAELEHQAAAIGGDLLALLDRRPQEAEVLIGAPLGRQRGGRALQIDPRLEDIGERRAIVFEEEAGVAGDHRRARRVHGGPAPGATPHGDQPFRLEDPERFAERRPGHPELLGECRLRRQRLALAQLAADDALAKVVGDELGRLGNPQWGR